MRAGKPLAAVLVLAAAARVCAPFAIERVVNAELAGLEGYRGAVEDVDLALWRGSLALEDFGLHKRVGETYAPLVAARRAELRLDLSRLLSCELIASLRVQDPVFEVVRDTAAPPTDWADLQRRLAELPRARVDRLELVDGLVRLRDPSLEPPLDLEVRDLNLTASNLATRAGLARGLPAELLAEARALDRARLSLRLRFDHLSTPPDFDLDASLADAELAALNPLLRAAGGIDAEGGRFGLFVEAAAADGAVKGYVKPVFEDARLWTWGEDRKDAAAAFLEAAAAAGAELLENQPKSRLAARVPFSGRLEDPEVGVLPAVASVLRNAFIQALRPRLDRSLRLPKKELAP